MGIFNKILGSIVKSRTDTAKALDKASDDLKKSLAKTKKARAARGNKWAQSDNALSRFQEAHDKKYGNKY